ncbi:2-hydroxyacid dehydrogenase [Arsukibacterium indicum]|uniref:Glyoxylate/hydroxypyruvate reductase A n=1 Tax=Arsukibacterium indicum TaxID=2848612 RepID=A0ABS6MKT6_9GAMM|nr:glyoxylate/hydroxypyruvate reductase A [Arsukibacterium indicum]MBV2129432.1 glyoxylate/hydroxypyruvate reductase A [Arsukibacterium indicum]
MSIALIIPDRKLDDLQQRLQQALPDTRIEIWPELDDPADVEFAVVWKQPHGCLSGLINLKAIQCFGAGVDSILTDPTLPDLPVSRIVDPALTEAMVGYLDGIVSYYRLQLDVFTRQQQQSLWRPKSPRKLTSITVLGLGELGGAVANHFDKAGYQVAGWARSGKSLANIRCFAGEEQLQHAVAAADVIICLLPLTPATEQRLNQAFFQALKPGAIFINVARGAIVDDSALLTALQDGPLAAACLDVFCQEPLPKDSPFWQHPAVLITPHVSAVTNVSTVVAQIVENYQRALRGSGLLNPVDTIRGY